MKPIVLALATFTLAAPAAFAQSDRYDSRYDSRYENRNDERYDAREYFRDNRRPESARVLEARPVYSGESREECFNNRTRKYEELRDRGYLLNRSDCRIANYGGRISGYEVRYEYDGREYVTHMDRDPGRRLMVGRDINSNGLPLDAMGRDLDPNHSGG